MPRNPRDIITGPDRRFPIRIRIVLPGGFGTRVNAMTLWFEDVWKHAGGSTSGRGVPLLLPIGDCFGWCCRLSL
jgi:hypothetical protein